MPFAYEDQTARREKFEAEHQDIKITPPGSGGYWEAVDETGETVASAIWLEWLMDKLERKYS